MRFAYIANGTLWIQQDDRPPRGVQSRFVSEAKERAARSQRAHGWKNADRDEPRGLIPNEMLWRSRAATDEATVPRFRHVAPGPDDDTLFYVMELGRTVGLFEYHLAEDREVRILHSADFQCDGLHYDRQTDRLIIARTGQDGRTHLQELDREGNPKGLLTGGDCQDVAPTLSPGDPGAVHFQSSGLALHPNSGHVVALSPARVSRLDRRNREVTTLLEHEGDDCIAPRMDPRGSIYYIRRPYERPYKASFTDQMMDMLLFPWRLLKAVFGYLNFFSMIYGKEPLKTAGVPKGAGLDQDLGRLWLHGRLIEIAKVRRGSPQDGIVPGSWRLVRRQSDGTESVVAKQVASFDVATDGAVVYTNGFDIHRFPSRDLKPLARADLVEKVVALD